MVYDGKHLKNVEYVEDMYDEDTCLIFNIFSYNLILCCHRDNFYVDKIQSISHRKDDAEHGEPAAKVGRRFPLKLHPTVRRELECYTLYLSPVTQRHD